MDSTDANPFQRLRVRSVLWWGLESLPAALWLDERTAGIPVLNDLVPYSWAYGITLVWAACTFEWVGIKALRLVGRLPERSQRLPVGGLVALLMVFSVGTFDLLYYPLSFVAPQFVESVLNLGFGTNGSFCLFLIMVIVGPLTEELFFRGVLINRWTVKWGIQRALLTSSAVFAVIHTDPIGAFAFGFVMAVLYLETRSLWVPITCHVLNNAACIVWECLENGPGWIRPLPYTLNQYHSDVRIGAICLLLSTPWVVRFMLRHWPRHDVVAPYFAD